MRAIMLAAGLGRRLDGRHPPKSLLRVGGKSLLERHIEVLRDRGVDHLLLVVGHRDAELRGEVERLGASDFVRLQHNPDYERGSILSLWCARASLAEPDDVLIMDADVLYHPTVIDRLVQSPHPNCLLLDRDFEPGEEPVKVGVSDGRVVEFGKAVSGTGFDLLGEWPGFIKLSSIASRALVARMQALVAAGQIDAPMEDAVRALILRHPGLVAWEDVTGLPWIEIDFMEDLERARREVLARIDAVEQPLALESV
jgi:choline kinase